MDARRVSDYLPFEGKFDTVVPHATVAHGDEPLLCEIDVELRIAAGRACRRTAELVPSKTRAGAGSRCTCSRSAGLKVRKPSTASGWRARQHAHFGHDQETASGKFRLYSRKLDRKTGKRRNLGTFGMRAAAERHERAVQYFKRH
jgi:hypothetical protein